MATSRTSPLNRFASNGLPVKFNLSFPCFPYFVHVDMVSAKMLKMVPLQARLRGTNEKTAMIS